MATDTSLIDSFIMDCKKAQDCLYLFADEEMGEELLVTFRAHLGHCPDCQRRILYTRKLLALVRRGCAPRPAPKKLRIRILARLTNRGRGG